MAANPQTGTTGFITVNGATIAFSKWTDNMQRRAIPVNNFVAAPYQQTVAGIIKHDISLEMNTYDAGDVGLVAGTTYTVNLGTNVGAFISVPVQIEAIEIQVDVDGAQPVRVTGTSNGIAVPALL